VPASIPTLELASESADRTEALGRTLGGLLEPGHVVGLIGELGAGKTCFARGVAQGAAVPAEIYVSSPTFTLVNEYPGRILVVHIDLYRLGDAEELVELGVDHYCGGEGACLIEWFDRFADALPGWALRLSLAVTGDNSRELSLAGGDARHQDLARRFVAAAQRGGTP